MMGLHTMKSAVSTITIHRLVRDEGRDVEVEEQC